MPEISRFYGIVVQIYFDDHLPPHFHVFYGDDSAKSPSINKGINLACSFGLWLRCSSVTEALAMLLRRALPEAKTPTPSCHLNFLTAPKIAIENLAFLEGGLPARAKGLVVEWATIHREELLAAFQKAANLKPPGKIPQLQ